MRRYRFIFESVLPERLIRNPVVLELARNMEPEDIVTALVGMGIQPESAATTAGALMRHANGGMSMPYDTSKDAKKLGKKKRDNQDTSHVGKPMNTMHRHEAVMTPGADDDFPDSLFPDEDEEPEEWPYDGATIGVMGAPLANYSRKR